MGTIKVDADVFPSVAAFYQEQRGDMLEAKSYVQTYCTLGDSFGLLLSWLKGPYEDARDKGFGAFDALANLIDGLAHQVEGFQQDVEEQDASLQAQIDALAKEIQELREAQNSSNSGGYSGGGGGGGFSGGGGGGGYTPPTPSPVTPVDEAGGDRDINITINGGGGDDNIKVNVDADGNIDIEIDTEGEGDDETPELAPDPVPIDAVPAEPVLTPEEQAEYDAYLDQFWAEQAADDPLGRTADELRALWEGRDPVTPNPDDLVGVGCESSLAATGGVGGQSVNIGAVLPGVPIETGMRMTR